MSENRIPTLPFGKIALGQRDYNEFACSKSTAAWLQGGAMTKIDGQNVTLRVVAELGGDNVMMRFWTQDAA
jgi:hypothetical protein